MQWLGHGIRTKAPRTESPRTKAHRFQSPTRHALITFPQSFSYTTVPSTVYWSLLSMLVNKGVHACRLGYDVCSTAHIGRLKSSANDSPVADLRFPLSKNPVDIWNVRESTLLSSQKPHEELMREQWSVPDCRSLSPVSVDTNWSLTPRQRRRGNWHM